MIRNGTIKMEEFELFERISQGEGFHTEFKIVLPDNIELAKDIVCFANTDGGQLFIGVDDTGGIVGIEDVEGSMRKVDDIAYSRCRPSITVVQETITIDDKTILIVHVPKGRQRPYHTSSGQFYIRSTNRCRQASREELLRIFQASESIYFDETTVSNAHWDDLDLEYFNDFLDKYLHLRPEKNEIQNYLRNLHLVNGNNKPTLAGLLLFGKKPQQYLPNMRVICAFIKGTDLAIPPTDRKNLTGRISEWIEDAQKFLRLYLREEHKIKGFENEIEFEIPGVALREAIVNGIAHRNYTIDGPIRIIVYLDRVEIRTPGKLPDTVTIESMKISGSHILRNPTIYNVLLKMGLVTDLGAGVRRMIQLVRDRSNQEVTLEELENEFIVVFPRKKSD